MEWQGTITGDDGQPLGSFESVAAELTGMFRGLTFEWSRNGAANLAIADERGIEMPDMVRRVIAAQKSSLGAALDDGLVDVSFNLGSEEPVGCVWATVGGEPVLARAALARLLQRRGWIVESPKPLEVVKLEPDQALQLSGGATLFFEDSPSIDERSVAE